MKTVSIIGNRPQLMKLIPELADIVFWTGQHYSEVLKGAYSKQLDKCGRIVDLGETTIEGIYNALLREFNIILPQLVTVYGDTSSTLAGALAGNAYEVHAGTEVAHVEAGLRCGNELLPEERNRIVVDMLSTHLFDIPTYGDIMQERLWEFWNEEMGRQRPTNKNEKWICTVHRAENSDDPQMMKIIKNINTFVRRPRIYLHPKAEHLFTEYEKWRLPTINSAITYHQMMRELWNCEGVITDSGGLMREAAWLGKPCIVLRNECEFPELVEANRIKLVGQSEAKLRDALAARDWQCKVELENPDTTGKILKHLGIERKFHAEESENVVCDACLSV